MAANGSVLIPVLLGHPLPRDAWVTAAGSKLSVSLKYQGQLVQVGVCRIRWKDCSDRALSVALQVPSLWAWTRPC